MKSPKILLLAGLFGASGVALGAFGAHALRVTLTELGTRDRWETAVFYQLVHTVALFAAAVWVQVASGTSAKRVGNAALCWGAGILLFSGSLYVMSLTANAPLWFKIAVPPLGGTAFMVGWLFVLSAAFGQEK